MITASEIATMAAALIQKSTLAVPFVRLNSQGEANRTSATIRLYRSRTDSLRHFLMAQPPFGRLRETATQEKRGDPGPGSGEGTRSLLDFRRSNWAWLSRTVRR